MSNPRTTAAIERASAEHVIDAFFNEDVKLADPFASRRVLGLVIDALRLVGEELDDDCREWNPRIKEAA